MIEKLLKDLRMFDRCALQRPYLGLRTAKIPAFAGLICVLWMKRICQMFEGRSVEPWMEECLTHMASGTYPYAEFWKIFVHSADVSLP